MQLRLAVIKIFISKSEIKKIITDTTLRSHLVRPKDALEPTGQDGVVYKIPRECGKVYIGETGRVMQDRIRTRQRYAAYSYTNLRSFGAR